MWGCSRRPVVRCGRPRAWGGRAGALSSVLADVLLQTKAGLHKCSRGKAESSSASGVHQSAPYMRANTRADWAGQGNMNPRRMHPVRGKNSEAREVKQSLTSLHVSRPDISDVLSLNGVMSIVCTHAHLFLVGKSLILKNGSRQIRNCVQNITMSDSKYNPYKLTNLVRGQIENSI